MTALANSLLRIWSAKSRSLRLTGRRQAGIQVSEGLPEKRFQIQDRFEEFAEAVQRTTPMVLAVALQILR
jgi:hypothetical protein